MLEVFKRVKVPEKLSTMMDTEAVFNDATGITIFTLLLTSFGGATFNIFSAAFDFLFVFGGGAIIGLGVAFAANRLLRVIRDPISESILTLVAVYGAYSLASSIGVSGLIAVATAGIAMGSPRRGATTPKGGSTSGTSGPRSRSSRIRSPSSSSGSARTSVSSSPSSYP